VHAIGSKHLASIRYAETLIALCGFGNRALKTDRSLIDLIMRLKTNCPEIKEYLHISQYDLLIDTSRMRLTAFTILMPIGRLPDT
jgi:hypothetical protein